MSGSRALRLAVLLSLIWRIGSLSGQINRCGPVGPHGHGLLGRAGWRALAEHLAAESACREGAAPEPQVVGDKAGPGVVISTGDLRQLGAAPSGLGLTVLAPALAAPELPAELWSALALPGWHWPSLEQPPPSPPPCPIECVVPAI